MPNSDSRKYKTELHTHSAPVSNCASVKPEEIVERYLSEGYTTVVLSNHLSCYTYKNERFDRSGDPWDKKIDYYLSGYNDLKLAAGDRLNILLAIELRLDTDGNDYLLHGADENFLRTNPDLPSYKISDLSKLCRKNGVLLYQAHPFRNGMKVTKPDLLYGIEVFNGHRFQESRNDIAELWAEKFSLHKISGSDFHHVGHIVGGGIYTDEPVTTEAQLLDILKSGNYELIRDGVAPY